MLVLMSLTNRSPSSSSPPRSRAQRYARSADWDYVAQVAAAAAPSGLQVVGNGDVVSFEDWERHCGVWGTDGPPAGCGVATCLVARGALVKPWLFTEVRERRHWDISAPERLDLLRAFVRLGLAHWGSDGRGVESTRRFLLEWLRRDARPCGVPPGCGRRAPSLPRSLARSPQVHSRPPLPLASLPPPTALPWPLTPWPPGRRPSFAHRYIPVGLLERLPGQHLGWRVGAAPFEGRSDLETLLGSPAPADWVRLSVMLLGPTPPGFVFAAKHKAGASEAADAFNG